MTQLPYFTDAETFEELLNPAMEIAKAGDFETANEYVRLYVKYLRGRENETTGKPYTQKQAYDTVMTNVGYYAGYYDTETMQAVHQVFDAEHPIFGTMAPPCPHENTATVEDDSRIVGRYCHDCHAILPPDAKTL